MARVGVWTEYCWECNHCTAVNVIDYQPDVGKTLPACAGCGHRDTCETIHEKMGPMPRRVNARAAAGKRKKVTA
mgnify:CR=1 FL=1